MQKIMSVVVVYGALAAVVACGGTVNGDAARSSGPVPAVTDRKEGADDGNDDRCPDRADFDTVSERIESQLNIARKAVCKYRHLEAALADGYTNSGLPCIPGQGYHYIKGSLVGTTDIRHPSVLMYTADGRLNGPEWIAPKSQFATPPSIFGQMMHTEDELGLRILHVWVWKLNADGVFSDVNAAVTCP